MCTDGGGGGYHEHGHARTQRTVSPRQRKRKGRRLFTRARTPIAYTHRSPARVARARASCSQTTVGAYVFFVLLAASNSALARFDKTRCDDNDKARARQQPYLTAARVESYVFFSPKRFSLLNFILFFFPSSTVIIRFRRVRPGTRPRARAHTTR